MPHTKLPLLMSHKRSPSPLPLQFQLPIRIGSISWALATAAQICLASSQTLGPAMAVETAPVGSSRLTEVTARGRQLAEYERTVARALERLGKTFPETAKGDRFQQYLANKSAKGWTVSFGALSKNQDSFTVLYEAVESKPGGKFQTAKCKPGTVDNGLLLRQALAVKVCSQAFPGNGKKNTYAVLAAQAGRMYVYVYPAHTAPGIYPFGNDIRYTVSADGGTILDTRRMHKRVIGAPPVTDGAKPTMGVHVAALDDLPEDSDVMHVLLRKPPLGEMIATKHFVYMVDTDGSIKYRGTVDKILKKKHH